jgi:hypothetical protein
VALAALSAAAVAVFLAADLLTLGWWPPERVDATGGLDGAYSLLGVAFAVLVAARLLLGRRWRGTPPAPPPGTAAWERGLLLGAAACWLLAFPLVFEPLAEVVPGFGGMRAPTRTWPFVSFAVAWLAGRGLDGLLRRLRGRGGRLAVAAAACLWIVFESMPRPLAWHRVPEPPPVHRWIATAPGVEALLVLPLRRNEREIPAMWSSTAHWRPIVNGFSAFTPRAYRDLANVCCWPIPDDHALDHLRRMGVTHVVVHTAQWQRPWQHRALAAWKRRVAAGEVPGVREVYRDGRGDLVFAIAARDGEDAAASRR